MMYQLCPPVADGKVYCVKRLDPNPAFISINEESSDYQAYLKWLEEGNTPLPAEEPQ